MKFNYVKIIANLESKASRQKEALASTLEQIEAFRTLQKQEEPELPIQEVPKIKK